MRLHFLTSVILVGILTALAIHPDKDVRMLLLVPVLILFYMTIVFFGLEYEKDKETSWRKKEKKLVEETYLKFFAGEKQKN